jgi:type I restriction enzyme S subunit
MSKIEELIEKLCPDGVEYKTLEELFIIKNGYTPSKSKPEYWANGTIPWFRMEDIRANGRILSDSIQHITPEAIKGSKLFPANSIIVATTATIGEHALIIVDSLANQRFTFLSKRESLEKPLNIKFFYYYMFIIDKWCKEHVNNGGFASVDMTAFKKVLVPVPPLEIQEKIVEILDNFSSLTAELQAELQARKSQYEFYRNQLLTFDREDAATSSLQSDVALSSLNVKDNVKQQNSQSNFNTPTTIHEPQKVTWMKLEDVCEIKNGKDHKNLSDGEIPVYGSGGIMRYANKAIYNKCSVLIPRKGSIGNVFYVDKPFWTVDTIFYTVINIKIIVPKFLYYYICILHLETLNIAGGVPSMTQTTLYKLEIPIPPLSEQERIVAILDKFDALVNDISIGLPAEIEARQKQYEYYRDALLNFKHKVN